MGEPLKGLDHPLGPVLVYHPELSSANHIYSSKNDNNKKKANHIYC